MEWLEQEICTITGFDCRSVPTGTRVELTRRAVAGAAGASQQDYLEGNDGIESEDIIEHEDTAGQSLETDDNFSSAISAPEISALALNATGETRYLGPSSGIPFTGHAAVITRRLLSSRAPEHDRRTSGNFVQSHMPLALTDQDRVYENGEVKWLVEPYVKWVQPLYPLFETATLEETVKTCQELEATDEHSHDHSPQHALRMAEYYLVLALGAVHSGNVSDEAVRDQHSGDTPRLPSPKRDPTRLYLKSLEFFDSGSSDLQASILLIRVVLLMCIYGSHGKVGLGQWQLAGLAIRVSLPVMNDEPILIGSDGRRDGLASISSFLAHHRRSSKRPVSCFLDRLHHRNFACLQPWAPAVNWRRAHHCGTTSHSFRHANMRPSYKT